MEINWQDIFYITASGAMIVIFIIGIYLLRLLFIASKVVKSVSIAVRGWSQVVEDVAYFRKSVKSKIIGFILRILDKKDQYE